MAPRVVLRHVRRGIRHIGHHLARRVPHPLAHVSPRAVPAFVCRQIAPGLLAGGLAVAVGPATRPSLGELHAGGMGGFPAGVVSEYGTPAAGLLPAAAPFSATGFPTTGGASFPVLTATNTESLALGTEFGQGGASPATGLGSVDTSIQGGPSPIPNRGGLTLGPPTSTIPIAIDEPPSMLTIGVGLLGMALLRWRPRRR